MKSINYILIILISIGCSEVKEREVTETEVVESYPDGQPKFLREYLDKKDRLNYIIKEFHSNGKISFEGMVSKRKFTKYKKSYYYNGNPKQITELSDSAELTYCCPDGFYKLYYKNGVLKETNYKKDGLFNGLVIQYDTTGIKIAESEMLNNLRNGFNTKLYNDGKIKSRKEYRNDTLVGTVYHFHETGDSLKKYEVFKGQMDFPIKYWKKSGRSLLGEYFNGNYYKVKWTWRDSLRGVTKTEIVDTINGQFVTPDY